MYLYLDDIRQPKHNNFYIVRNYEDCIHILKNNTVYFLSLDHDLGEEKTGYDIAKFIVENEINIRQINIHSANPVGRDNIKQLIKHYFPDTIVTFDKDL